MTIRKSAVRMSVGILSAPTRRLTATEARIVDHIGDRLATVKSVRMEMGLASATVHRAVGRLHGLGVLARRGHRDRAALYSVTWTMVHRCPVCDQLAHSAAADERGVLPPLVAEIAEAVETGQISARATPPRNPRGCACRCNSLSDIVHKGL